MFTQREISDIFHELLNICSTSACAVPRSSRIMFQQHRFTLCMADTKEAQLSLEMFFIHEFMLQMLVQHQSVSLRGVGVFNHWKDIKHILHTFYLILHGGLSEGTQPRETRDEKCFWSWEKFSLLIDWLNYVSLHFPLLYYSSYPFISLPRKFFVVFAFSWASKLCKKFVIKISLLTPLNYLEMFLSIANKNFVTVRWRALIIVVLLFSLPPRARFNINEEIKNRWHNKRS